jgi:hypothetical protein
MSNRTIGERKLLLKILNLSKSLVEELLERLEFAEIKRLPK